MGSNFRQLYSRYSGFFQDILSQYKKRPDVKKFVELLLSIMSVTFFSLFAIKPTLITIISLTKEIKSKEETVKVMDKKIENLKKARTFYYQEKSAIDEMNLALPDNPSVEYFSGQLEAASYQNSLDLTQISFGEGVILGTDDKGKSAENTKNLPEKTGAVAISLHATAQYDLINQFINLLENLKRPLVFDIVSVFRPKDETESNSLELTLSGRVPFYLPLAIKAKPAESANNENEQK